MTRSLRTSGKQPERGPRLGKSSLKVRGEVIGRNSEITEVRLWKHPGMREVGYRESWDRRGQHLTEPGGNPMWAYSQGNR